MKLAIDDVGTGHSSLSYLRQFPVDTLKIDRSFVSAAGADRGPTVFLQTIRTLALYPGLDVTAEGIETETQLRRLRLLRCPSGQGYYFARPLPGASFEELLQRAAPLALPRRRRGGRMTSIRRPRPGGKDGAEAAVAGRGRREGPRAVMIGQAGR